MAGRAALLCRARPLPRARRRAPLLSCCACRGAATASQLQALTAQQALHRYFRSLHDSQSAQLAAAAALGACAVMAWACTPRRKLRGQVSEEVAGVACEILADEALQRRAISVANDILVERLADPATVDAATGFTLRVLQQPSTEDASRGLLAFLLGSSASAEQVTKLFRRVGGDAGTTEAVVTVFCNAFVDDSAKQLGTEYLRRVLTSAPVVGTCGGTASEQLSQVLHADSTRQLTHELVASVLEAESVQLAAAEFVWASLTGAEKQQHGQDQAVTPAPQDEERDRAAALELLKRLESLELKLGRVPQ